MSAATRSRRRWIVWSRSGRSRASGAPRPPSQISRTRSDRHRADTLAVTTPARRSATAAAGERKLVTMLFADLSGYTALAESLDPEEVYSFLRPTMLELQRVVESFGGSVP